MKKALSVALLAGVSYTDYWSMTYGEIMDLLIVRKKTKKAEHKHQHQLAAFVAYNAGLFSHELRNYPESPLEAFPELFDRTKTGCIKVENWQEGKAKLAEIMRIHNKNRAVTK